MSLFIVGDGVVWSVFGHALREGEPDATPTEEAKAEEPKEATPEEPIAADKEESAE